MSNEIPIKKVQERLQRYHKIKDTLVNNGVTTSLTHKNLPDNISKVLLKILRVSKDTQKGYTKEHNPQALLEELISLVEQFEFDLELFEKRKKVSQDDLEKIRKLLVLYLRDEISKLFSELGGNDAQQENRSPRQRRRRD